MSKTYIIVKDGETLKELKTLPAAKKLADAEGAEVFCEGESVYVGVFQIPGEDIPVPGTAVPERVAAEIERAAAEVPVPVSYALTAKMNIRKAPRIDAQKLGIAQAGTVVEVAGIEDDWLHLTDGTYILYGAGKFAEKTV